MESFEKRASVPVRIQLDPKLDLQMQVQFWIRLDLFQTGSKTVPCKQKAWTSIDRE